MAPESLTEGLKCPLKYETYKNNSIIQVVEGISPVFHRVIKKKE